MFTGTITSMWSAVILPLTLLLAKYPNDKGIAYGGYATHNRSKGHFVFPIPDALDSADVAPMLCAGITVYTPLKRNGCGPGKAVGIIGVSGLGHFGILFAKALGADKVVALSRKAEKRNDRLEMGADIYIATDDDDGWAAKHARTLDLIVSAVSSEHMPLTQYLGLLKIHGSHIQVGTGYGGKLPTIDAFSLLMSGVHIGGSVIGSPTEIREMLQLAADKNIKPWVQSRPMADANNAVKDMAAGKARYRYVLESAGL